MVWPPTANRDVLKRALAVPPTVVSVPWPMLAPPSKKATTPVGLTAVKPLTPIVAVKVTSCPKTEDVSEDTSTALLFPWPMISPPGSVAVLLAKLPSPL